MEVEHYAELPNGHCVNLQPRHNQGPYKAYRAHYNTTNLSTTPASTNHTTAAKAPGVADSGRTADIMLRKGNKLTKLPVTKKGADKDKDQSRESLPSTAIPRLSSPALQSATAGGQMAKPTDKDRDQYWRKLREKVDKEAPASQKVQRSTDDDKLYHSTSSQTTYSASHAPSHANFYHQHRYADDASRDNRTLTRVANTRTGMPSPNTSQGSSGISHRNDAARYAENEKQWRTQGDRYVSYGNTTTDSSTPSRPSVSPVSAEDTSLTDWEDRFVVNMPTAKDPNPPMMTAKQIAEFQRSIERVHRAGDQMLDPETSPSPQSSPEEKPSPEGQRDSKPTAFKAYDGSSTSLVEVDGRSTTTPQPHPNGPRPYYSPDEIGKKRFSTIWEESPSKNKDKRKSNLDGSFLGCKQIHGSKEINTPVEREPNPGERNPDEILFWSTYDNNDTSPQQYQPLSISKNKPKEERKPPTVPLHRTRATTEEKTVIREDWAPISQNLKHVQCSRPSAMTMCQDPQLHHSKHITDSQDPGKENSRPTTSPPYLPENGEHVPRDDDVFIITPTITRTLIPVDDQKSSAAKTQGLRRPRGGSGQSITGEAVTAVRAKPQVVSTPPSGLRPANLVAQTRSSPPTLPHSKTTQLSSIRTAKDKVDEEKSSTGKSSSGGIRGFIRTSGMVRSPTDSLASILRNGAGSLRLADGKLKLTARTQPSPPSRDNSDSLRSESSRSDMSFLSARASPCSSAKEDESRSRITKVVEIAELDGQQVSNRKETKDIKESKESKEKKEPNESKETRQSSSAAARAERREARAQEKKVNSPEKKPAIRTKSTPEKLKSSTILDKKRPTLAIKDSTRNDGIKDGVNPMALSLVFEIVIVAMTQAHRNFNSLISHPHVKAVIGNILNMTRHCYHVFMIICRAVSVYQATGTWPKAENDQALGRFLVELLQAIIYLLLLGFGAVVVGRIAGYVVLVGSWVVWFVRPFAWAFQLVGVAVF